MSLEAVHKMLTKELENMKIFARWITHLLNEKQKINRVSCAKKINYSVRGKKLLFSNTITGDETSEYVRPQRK